MSEKAAEIAELEERYVGFRDLIATLPPEAFEEGGLGDWTLAQLLAHMAGWFRLYAGAFERVGQGGRPRPEGEDWSDVDAWNATWAANPKPGAEALDDWDLAFHDFYAAAKGLDESLFGADPEKGRPRIGSRLLEGAGTGHFQEHRDALEAWLNRRG